MGKTVNARAILAAVLPGGLWQQYTKPDERPIGSLLVTKCAIPAASVASGDVFFYSVCPEAAKRWRRQFRGVLHRVPRSDFPALIEHARAFELVATSDPAWCQGASRFLAYVRNADRQRRLGKAKYDSTSLVFLIRPFGLASRPIEADSDRAALFELLASVGCRMPRKEA